MEKKPAWKSLTLRGVVLTALGIFAPEYLSAISSIAAISGVAGKLTAIAGLIVTTIGRLRATQEVTFTGAQKQ